MNRKKRILAAIVAAFVFFVPLASMAQIELKDAGDGAGAGLEGTWDGMQITDYETESYVPVGDALWLLAGASGLYLLAKSRKTRKATATMAAALLLTLGTTQCNKQSETLIPAGETIFISLNGGNGSGSKADINVNNGCITWNADDEVYVVCNNATATSKDNAAVLLTDNLTAQTGDKVQAEITGSVTVPEGYTLPEEPSFTFYYVGKGVEFTPAESATKLTFKIANQDGHDAGEYMIGRTETIVMEKGADGTYKPKDNPDEARKFTPLTSVLRLNTSGFGSSCEMTMSKGNNKMKIDLSNPDNPDYAQGNISFAGGEDVQISVMPSTEVNVNATLNFSGNSKQGSIKVKNGVKPGRIYAKIINNASTPILVEAIPEGALPGLFSVSADKQVRFSKGNLRYYDSNNDGTCEFMFEEKQWEYRGSYNTADCGHFLWSKDKSIAVASSYSDSGAAIGDVFFTNEEVTTPNPNFHVNGEMGVNVWRVLSNNEWQYLLGIDEATSYRQNAQSLYLYKTLTDENGKNVKGLVILPDGTDQSQSVMDGISTTSELSDYDAVFIPDAGNRTTGTIQAPMGYWTSTCSNSSKQYAINLRKNGQNIEATYNGRRSFGNAVRLVHDVPNTDGTIIIDNPGSGGL